MTAVVKIPRKQGRPRKRVLQTAETPLARIPPPPSWLSKAAKAEWVRCAPHLSERNVITEADLGSLEAYCSAKGRLVAAERVIERDGITIVGKDGQCVKHPAVSVADAASATLRAIGMQLGLTPASRRKAARSEEAPASDRWAGLIDG
jgi:P27 family predicted phage terminase small subunit